MPGPPSGHLHDSLNGPFKSARTVNGPVQITLGQIPSGLTKEPPRDLKRSVVSSTVRLAGRPGHLQPRPQLLSWGYFRLCTHSKPILILPKLPLYLYKPISNQLNP